MATFKLSPTLKRQLQKKASDYIVIKNSNKIISEFEKTKQQMISEFLSHPITKEINGGAYAENITGTLSGIDSGNLFSFIGFELGSDPISPIENVLKDIKINLIRSSDIVYVSIIMPTPENIWQITPMPWQEGRSWAKGIESRIYGLNYYLFNKKLNDGVSRSTVAVQKEKQIRSYARYIPTQYISALLKKYKTIFSSKYAKNNSIFINI